MNIADLYVALRADGAKLIQDVVKAATAAGDEGGKKLGSSLSGSLSKGIGSALRELVGARGWEK